MTGRLLQGIVGLALAGGIGLMVIPAKARLAGQTAAGDQKAGQRLEGSWVVRTTRANAPPPLAPTLLSLQTYTPTGEMIEASNSLVIRTVAQGEWVRTGDRQFTRRWLLFRFDSLRNFIGFSRVTAKTRLNRKGNRFVGEGTIERFDTTGQLELTDQTTEDGRRCGVATSLSRCLGIE